MRAFTLVLLCPS